MANQMDSLIENGSHQMDEFINDLYNRIEKFIKENGYTWTVEEIVKEYRERYTQEFYVSFTCKKVIENFEEDLAKSVQARVSDGFAKPLNFREVAVLFFADRGIAGEEIQQGVFPGFEKREIFGIDAVGIHGPLGFEAEHLVEIERIGILVDRRVRPDFDGEMAGGIGEGEFEIGFARLGHAGGAGLELGVDGGNQRFFSGGFLEGGDGDRTHESDFGWNRRPCHARSGNEV